MRPLAVVALLALAAGPLAGQRAQTLPRWSSEQKTGAVLALSAIALDCGTTVVAMHRPGTRELNPILGRHPSDLKIAAACLTAGGAVLVIADRLPRKVRGWWLGAVYAAEMIVFAQNLSQLARR